ncbi:unnamed protein product, partial [Durusdinium trenchii]
RSNKLQVNRRLNLEQVADSKDLSKFMEPAGLVPGGSMLPLPKQAPELSSDEELSGEDAEALAAEDLARSERKK